MKKNLRSSEYAALRARFSDLMSTRGFQKTALDFEYRDTFFREYNDGEKLQICELEYFDPQAAALCMLPQPLYLRAGILYRSGFLSEWEEDRAKGYVLQSCDDCHIRFHYPLGADSDPEPPVDNLLARLDARMDISREEDRTEWKRMEKALRSEYHTILKPYGAKKKGSHSVFTLSNGVLFDSDLQKSAYGDTFYCNISLTWPGDEGNIFSTVYSRIWQGLDWQLADMDVVFHLTSEFYAETIPIWSACTDRDELIREGKRIQFLKR